MGEYARMKKEDVEKLKAAILRNPHASTGDLRAVTGLAGEQISNWKYNHKEFLLQAMGEKDIPTRAVTKKADTAKEEEKKTMNVTVESLPAEQEVKELKHKCDLITDERDALKQLSGELEAENRRLSETVANLRNDECVIEKELTELRNAKDETDRSRALLLADKEVLEQNTSRLAAQNMELQEKLKNAEEQLENTNREYAEFSAMYADLKTRYTNLWNENEENIRRLNEKTAMPLMSENDMLKIIIAEKVVSEWQSARA